MIEPEEDRYEPDDATTGFDIPWNLRATLTYSNDFKNKTYSKKFYTNLNLDFNLTKNWKISWWTRIDLKDKNFVSQDFTFRRDLHCWEARLQVVPDGPGKGYWFVIAIKDIPEIKYEQRRTVY